MSTWSLSLQGSVLAEMVLAEMDKKLPSVLTPARPVPCRNTCIERRATNAASELCSQSGEYLKYHSTITHYIRFAWHTDHPFRRYAQNLSGPTGTGDIANVWENFRSRTEYWLSHFKVFTALSRRDLFNWDRWLGFPCAAFVLLTMWVGRTTTALLPTALWSPTSFMDQRVGVRLTA